LSDHASHRHAPRSLRAAALDRREPLQRIRRVQAPCPQPNAIRRLARRMLPWLIDDVEEIDDVFGGDAFPYGIGANPATLQALVAYMVEQHFIARPIPIEDLFVPLAGAIGT